MEEKARNNQNNMKGEEEYMTQIEAKGINETLTKEEREKKEAIARVAVLVRELVGSRSIRRTGEDTKVAASYITGILKERYLPSAETLRKLTAPSSNVQNGVTLEDLMIAAGYQNNYIEEALPPDLLMSTDGRNVIIENTTSSDEGSARRIDAYANAIDERERRYNEHREFERDRTRFKNFASGVIYKTLSENGFNFINTDSIGLRGFRPDMALRIPQKSDCEWWFDIRYIKKEIYSNRPGWQADARMFLGRYIFIEPRSDRKVSLVTSVKEFFNVLIGFKDKLSYRGDLSVILIDEDTFTVVQEVYLAHYDEQGNDSEFYII